MKRWNFYKGIFGGTLEMQTYDETPDSTKHAGMQGKVLHAALHGGEINLMACDAPHADPHDPVKVSIALSGRDEQKLLHVFDALSDGGSITYPLKKEAWGDIFGMLTDQYGFHWMISIRQADALKEPGRARQGQRVDVPAK